jgi:SNF2 family DNA or RNA helicase
MRRNKESEINGHKILQLPPKTTNLTSLEFDSEERRIYVAIEQRARVQINKFIKAGTLMKNYSVVLVLLTRLRQCVNHPWLLRRKPGEEGDDRDILVEEGVDEEFGGQADKSCKNDADEYARAVALVGADTVDSIKRKLEDRYLRMVDESSDEDQDMVG